MAKVNAINNKSGELTIDPGASGDSFLQFSINATQEFRIGVDDDDSDKFKISQGSALGTNDTFIMTADGEITMPLQVAFSAYNSTTASGVTGNGTVYTVEFDTEVFDQNDDYDNATDTFTAPVTGLYSLHTTVHHVAGSGDGGEVAELKIVTSNRTYTGTALPTLNQVSNFYGPNSIITHEYAVLADMDAGDTAYVTFTASGGFLSIDEIYGGAVYTKFSGFLAC